MKRIVLCIITGMLVLLVVASIGFVAWAETAPGGGSAAQKALQSDARVQVQREPWLVFSPQQYEPTTGFIFYPGGRVGYDAYAPPLRQIAEQGFLVVVVPMPLNLAFFAPERADDVIKSYPSIKHWVIGGHSLGGAMAASYASQQLAKVQGLVLWAAYATEDASLATASFPIAQIYGTQDTVLNAERLAAGAAYLPPSTVITIIEGGNHAQFGDYGAQPGDSPASITAADQQQQAVEATLMLLQAVDHAHY